MRILIIAAATSLLAACASYEIHDSRLASGTYAETLYSEYRRVAEAERAANDWGSFSMFAERANMTAAGRPPMPLPPADVNLPAGRKAEAGLLRQRLNAAIADGAKGDAGIALARAQAAYEHWLELLEDGNKPAEAEKARNLFSFYIGGVDAHMQ